MRLWHYKLIPVLPRQQLLGQWRELCAITKTIAYDKTPHHPLVNKIVEYPAWMYYCYITDVEKEFKKRGYRIFEASRYAIYDNSMKAEEEGYFADDDLYDFNQYMNDPFPGWHNDRYLMQCYFNLEEKYDCGLISEDDFKKIERLVSQIGVWL